MNRRMGKRKLTRLILAALMATGGGLWGLSSVEAAEADVTTDTEINTNQSSTNFRLMGSNITFTVKGTGKTGNLLVDATDSTYIGNTFVLESGGEITGYNNFGGSKNNTWNIYGSVTSTDGAGRIAGGMGNGDGEFSGNKVNVFEGAQISTAVYGAYSPNYATITNNTVTITGGTFSNPERMIAGGHSTHGIVTNNTVAISGDTTAIAGDVCGGFSEEATVGGASADEGNKVTVSGGTINGHVFGGYSHKWDDSGTGDVTYNTVNISGTSTNIGGNVYGGYSDSAASNNTVTISGGTVTGEVYGGSGRVEANNNTVTISGGKIGGTVIGGLSSTSDATGNTVTISGGDFTDANTAYAMVSGGQAYTGTASNNIVNILAPITLFGVNGGSDNGSGTGNTVNIAAKNVVLTNNMYGVQNLNFYLPSDIAKGDTMLTIKGENPWMENPKTDLSKTTFGVTALKGVSLAKGDTVNLVVNPNGLTTAATLSTTDSASLGTASFLTANNLATDTKYTLGISKSGDNTIIATVENVTEESGGGGSEGGGSESGNSVTEDRLKSPVETRAAAVTLLNAGADMLASQGFSQAANAVALEAAEQAKNAEPGAAAPAASTFTPFAAFGGSSMRAESGSHVDTKGFGINVGFAKEFPNSQGKLLFGPVVEYGGGKYDSYNNDIHADGNSHYWGVGLMARQVNHDSFYYEGSVRFGRVTSDYGANFPAGRVSYDSASNYWAAHLGLGKVFATGKQDTVDAYLKYFYSHQGGDDTTIHIVGGNDEQASFDSVDSNRIRIGARYTHKINEMNSFYGGLAYQYEFGGEARAHYSVSGEAPSPSVKGSSGMLELGWQVKPGGPVTIDLGVTGWVGKQRGGSVQLGATWTF